MRSTNAGAHVLLALAIAVTAVVATIIQSFQFLDGIDANALITTQILGGALATASSGLAMLCGILVAQKMLVGSIDLVRRVESAGAVGAMAPDDGV